MTDRPRVSLGLPVYDGEDYISQSLDAILGQTFTDFELIISSNASTDGTDEICREYGSRDERIRFFRQPENIGAARNHQFVFERSRADLFKWVSADDLYARNLLARCVALLDEHPEAILAHSWTAAVDGDGDVIQAMEYPLSTDSPHPPERLRSMLFDGDLPGAIRADDFYGVIRSDVLRKVKPHGSFYNADRTYMLEIALHGPFVQVPEFLYFRRHHAGRTTNPAIHAWCSNLDPRRSNPLLHPAARLVAEYLLSCFAAVRRAPLSPSDRRECYGHITRWIGSRITRRLPSADRPVPPTTFGDVRDAAASLRSVAVRHESGT